jgi:hypothetical protein
MTRIFAYNSHANTFLLPQVERMSSSASLSNFFPVKANFVNPGFFHNVTLWTVDSQGNTTSVQVWPTPSRILCFRPLHTCYFMLVAAFFVHFR